MATYQDLNITDATFTADLDLTAKQYYFVMAASTAGKVTTSTGASNPAPLGVLQNSPSAGQEARVRVLGFSKLTVEVGTSLVNWARYVFCASDGQGEAVTGATCPINALWLDASVTSGSARGQVYLFGAGFGACPLAAS